MTDKKISDLTAITGASTASDDLFVMVDSSEGVTKKITRAELNNALERDTFATVDIDSGTIDGTTIGGSTPAAISGTTITGTSFVSSGDMTFGDDDKAIFGAGSDLQIYHDGSNSYIVDNGTGDLFIRAENNLYLKRTNSDETYLSGAVNDAVTLYHNNNPKLATTISGVDVTGTVTADGLTIDGGNTLRLNALSTTDFFTIIQGGTQAVLTADSDGAANMLFKTASAGVDTDRMQILSNGDIAFYDSTGVSQDLYWDASTSRLGLGTTAPTRQLTIQDTSAQMSLLSDTTSSSVLNLGDTDDDNIGRIAYNNSNNSMTFRTNASDALTIDSSGNLLLGKTSVEYTSEGFSLRERGEAYITSDGRAPLLINRLTSDGSIVDFRKDGTTVGSIGVNTTRPYLASTSMGVKVSGTSLHTTNSSGNSVDASYDLGQSTFRWKDLYLSGGISGGAGTVNTTSFAADSTYSSILKFNHSYTGSTKTNVLFLRSGSTVGSITDGPSSVSYNTSSDYRLKEDWQPMTGATERIKALNPVNFAWKVDGSRVDGFLAHEAQEVVPEAVTGTKDAVDADGNPEYQGIDQSKLVPLLTAALQEAIAKIETLEQRITTLENA